MEVWQEVVEMQDRDIKAYKVTDREDYCDFSMVIFAKTREQARVIAMRSDSFYWYDFGYTDFRVTRIPALDKYYRGVSEMDWDNAEDRIAMVKEARFVCSYEYEPADLECKQCPAKQWCLRYQGAECEVEE